MIPNPNPLFEIALFFGILFFIILTFLPSIIELKKPKDPGPRIIREYDIVYIHDLDLKKTYEEDELKVNTLIFRDAMAFLTFLPDLESQ